MDRVLIVDDDRELCGMLARYLTSEGFVCQVAHDGQEALHLAWQDHFDALVLDIMLPRLDGLEVLRRLRGRKATPVIMLTARGEDSDSITGLEVGADDYLTKPCNPKVLVARLKAVLRRSRSQALQPTPQEILRHAEVVLQPGSRLVTVAGRVVELTSAEFSLLHVLMLQAGQVVAKEELCHKGLGRKLTSYDRSVDLHISNLRRKLGILSHGRSPIVTVRGVGYQYVVAEE